MNKVKVVVTSYGEYTDVWLDGKYSRIPGAIPSEAIAYSIVRNFRRKVMRCN